MSTNPITTRSNFLVKPPRFLNTVPRKLSSPHANFNTLSAKTTVSMWWYYALRQKTLMLISELLMIFFFTLDGGGRRNHSKLRTMPIRTLFLSALFFFFYLVIFPHLTSVGWIFSFLYFTTVDLLKLWSHFFDIFFFACNHFDRFLSINFSFSSHFFSWLKKNNNKKEGRKSMGERV